MSFIYLMFAYLIGSIPTGKIYAWIRKVDITKIGSQTTGATNVSRAFGKKGFASVFILDFLKSFLYLLLLKYLITSNFHIINDNILFLTSIFLLLGNAFSIFNNFKGGKAVATAFGAMLFWSWESLSLSMIVFFIILRIWKMVSLASMIAIFSNIIWSYLIYKFMGISIYAFYISVFTFIFSLFTHRKNIIRIINKEESKINKPSK